MTMDGGGRRVVGIGEGRFGSPELATLVVSGLGGDDRLANIAHGVMPQLVAGSLLAVLNSYLTLQTFE
jgi:hypothetical protein